MKSTDSMPTFDVAIIGAGPAGAWTAIRLARRGARVALLDGSHPREKPCGGGITGRALELIESAVDVGTFPVVPVAGVTFTHGTRAAYVPLIAEDRQPPLVIASREAFDGALLDAAVASGAVWVRERVTRLQKNGVVWSIATRAGSVAARWLLGADGATSLVRRTVYRPFSRHDLSIATGFFVRGRSSSEIAVHFEDEPAGYLWSFPRSDHLAVGICAQADAATPGPLLARAAEWIRTHVGPANTLVRYSWPIPSLGTDSILREQPSGDGWMLLGDAAGLVDPITREGIYFALRSADIAADTLLNGAEPAASYAARVRLELHDELFRAARLKARFFRPHFMSLLLSGLQRSGRIRRVMADLVAGRQPYRGLRRRLVTTLELKLMWELFVGR